MKLGVGLHEPFKAFWTELKARAEKEGLGDDEILAGVRTFYEHDGGST